MRSFPAARNWAIVAGAALWTFSAVFFAGQAIVQAASARPYSLMTNFISDLGNTSCGPDVCSPLHGLMNVTFVVAGLCHAAGAILTRRSWPARRFVILGPVLLALAGAGLAVAGLAPENESRPVHAAAAVTGLVSLNLAMIVLGSMLLDVVRWLAVTALAAGTLGFLGFGLFVKPGSGVPIGLAERLADYPGAAMIVVFGVFLLSAMVAEGRTILGRKG